MNEPPQTDSGTDLGSSLLPDTVLMGVGPAVPPRIAFWAGAAIIALAAILLAG